MSDVSEIKELGQESLLRSKEAAAAAAHDLDEHNRWFKDYVASEQRKRRQYARWVSREEAKTRRSVKLQEAKESFRISRQRMAHSYSRAARRFVISARSVSRLLLKQAYHWLALSRELTLSGALRIRSTSVAFSNWLLGLISAGVAWTRVKGGALLMSSRTAASHWLALSRELALRGALRIKSSSVALSNWLLRLVSASGSWTRIKGSALLLSSREAASISYFWIAAKTREVGRRSLRGASLGTSSIVAKTRRLSIYTVKAASLGASSVVAKTRRLSSYTLRAASVGASSVVAKTGRLRSYTVKAASVGASSVVAKTRRLRSYTVRAASAGYYASASYSNRATSRAAAWTSARAHTTALARFELTSTGLAWTAARTRDLARNSSELALATSHKFTMKSFDVVSVGQAWTTANVSALTRASSRAAANGNSWITKKSGELALMLPAVRSTVIHKMQALAQSIPRIAAMRSVARAMAQRQRERVSLWSQKVNGWAKGEIDALKQLARAGRLSPSGWRVFPSHEPQSHSSRGTEPERPSVLSSEGPRKVSEKKGGASTALICVEPWRCRLPAVQADRRHELHA